MEKKWIRFLLSFLIVSITQAFSITSLATFVPEGEIRYDLLSTGVSQITEEEFKERIAQLQKAFEPLVAKHGGKLSIVGDWKNEKLNARATQMFGTWKVEFTGGLARRPELSGDGMTLIVCHEVGHHLGGFPFGAGDPFSGTWAASEGEADYFSTHVCAKKLWGQDSAKNAEFREKVHPQAKEKCDEIYNGTPERDLCYRTTVAVESMIQTMANLMNKPMPQFNTPDPAVVDTTSSAHPAVQCRMDTVFQGSICTAFFDDLLIPGKKVKQGPNSREAEQEAALSSCTKYSGFDVGLRPACWFKARM